MMIVGSSTVNNADNVAAHAKKTGCKKTGCEKKPGSNEPGLRYWPREADTITFQEGLLNLRVTGGGGLVRDANAQCPIIMLSTEAMQQP
jgi:hypothetical protein